MSEALVVGVVRQAIEIAVMVTMPMLAAGLTEGSNAQPVQFVIEKAFVERFNVLMARI